MDEISNNFGSAEQLWQLIKNYSIKAGREATRIVLELYYVLKSPNTPALDKTLIIAALGYQLLPDDKKLLSREKHGLMGLLDNGAALALAYNRVKARVTPQIQAQVDAILNQWFGIKWPKIDVSSEYTIFTKNEDRSARRIPIQHATNTPFLPYHDSSVIEVIDTDEDVIID